MPPFRQSLVASWEIADDQRRWLPVYHDVGTSDPRALPATCGGGGPGSTSCAPGQACVEGVCVAGRACRADADCGLDSQCHSGSCVPIRSCASDSDCLAGSYCASGACRPDACVATSDCAPGSVCNARHCRGTACAAPPPCASGLSSCAGGCTDTSTDRTNCGACGTSCAPHELCLGGACSACAAGLAHCGDAADGSPTCLDLRADHDHCGGCTNRCPAGTVCADRVCQAGCAATGLTTCGALCVDVQTDSQHCGTCTTACPAADDCIDGACVVRCAPGLTSCGSGCADLGNDPAHCGACDHDCAPGETCASGSCSGACAAGSSCIGAMCSASPTPRAGVLWTHTPGPRDASVDFAPALVPGAPSRLLTSHYWSGAIALPRFLVVPPLPSLGDTARYLGPWMGGPICLECVSSFPGSFIAIVPGAPTSPGDPVLDIAGARVAASEVFRTVPIADPALRWVAAAEPEEWLGPSSIRYAAIDSTGGAAHVLALGPAGFTERAACGPSGCAAPSPCEQQQCIALAVDPPPSPGVPVLSATRSTLYAIGVTDGLHFPVITALPLGGVDTALVPLGDTTLGSVLAATYSPSRRALFVIDDVGVVCPRWDGADGHGHDDRGRDDGHHDCCDGRPSIRLSVVPVDGTGRDAPGLTELARWGGDGDDRTSAAFALAEDPGGNLYLVRSSHGEHVVLLVDASVTPARAVSVTRGAGALAAPQLAASRLGLTLAVHGRGRARTIGYRPSDFRTAHRAELGDALRP